MATFVHLHGAGGHGSDWALVVRLLEAAGHTAIAPDLPCEEESSLGDHTAVVVDAIEAGLTPDTSRADAPPTSIDGGLVLVAHSLAGLIAPLVCTQVPVDLMVLVAAMIPSPGETGHEWWTNTGHEDAVAAQGLPDDSVETLFLHDVPPDVLAASQPPRDQTATLFEEPWPLSTWPNVDTRFLVCRDDRFFPRGWLRALVSDRLGIEPVEVPGGHVAHLSEPDALARAVLGCWEHHRLAANGSTDVGAMAP